LYNESTQTQEFKMLRNNKALRDIEIAAAIEITNANGKISLNEALNKIVKAFNLIPASEPVYIHTLRDANITPEIIESLKIPMFAKHIEHEYRVRLFRDGFKSLLNLKFTEKKAFDKLNNYSDERIKNLPNLEIDFTKTLALAIAMATDNKHQTFDESLNHIFYGNSAPSSFKTNLTSEDFYDLLSDETKYETKLTIIIRMTVMELDDKEEEVGSDAQLQAEAEKTLRRQDPEYRAYLARKREEEEERYRAFIDEEKRSPSLKQYSVLTATLVTPNVSTLYQDTNPVTVGQLTNSMNTVAGIEITAKRVIIFLTLATGIVCLIKQLFPDATSTMGRKFFGLFCQNNTPEHVTAEEETGLSSCCRFGLSKTASD
jgi:hypothetical protein